MKIDIYDSKKVYSGMDSPKPQQTPDSQVLASNILFIDPDSPKCIGDYFGEFNKLVTDIDSGSDLFISIIKGSDRVSDQFDWDILFKLISRRVSADNLKCTVVIRGYLTIGMVVSVLYDNLNVYVDNQIKFAFMWDDLKYYSEYLKIGKIKGIFEQLLISGNDLIDRNVDKKVIEKFTSDIDKLNVI